MVSTDLLRPYPYFAGVSEGTLDQLAMIADKCFIPANTELFREGDPAKYLSIIARGEVNIQYLLGSEELRSVDTLVQGDILGWSALVEPYRYTAVGTTSKDTELIRIDSAKLRALCEQDPLMGYRLTVQIAKLLGQRLEHARIQLAAAE